MASYTPSYDYSRYSATPSPPPSGSLLYDLSYTDEHLAIKVALRNKLKQNKLSNAPMGFPVFLRHAYPQYPSGKFTDSTMKLESREFYEEVYTSTSTRQSKHFAKVSFMAPSKSSDSDMLHWTISVPARGSFGWQHNDEQCTIAHVQLNPAVLEDPNLGNLIMSSSRVINEALAISLELGVVISIAIASSSEQSKGHFLPHVEPKLVLLATSHDHKGFRTVTLV